jgi:hypothetical protein
MSGAVLEIERLLAYSSPSDMILVKWCNLSSEYNSWEARELLPFFRVALLLGSEHFEKNGAFIPTEKPANVRASLHSPLRQSNVGVLPPTTDMTLIPACAATSSEQAPGIVMGEGNTRGAVDALLGFSRGPTRQPSLQASGCDRGIDMISAGYSYDSTSSSSDGASFSARLSVDHAQHNTAKRHRLLPKHYSQEDKAIPILHMKSNVNKPSPGYRTNESWLRKAAKAQINFSHGIATVVDSDQQTAAWKSPLLQRKRKGRWDTTAEQPEATLSQAMKRARKMTDTANAQVTPCFPRTGNLLPTRRELTGLDALFATATSDEDFVIKLVHRPQQLTKQELQTALQTSWHPIVLGLSTRHRNLLMKVAKLDPLEVQDLRSETKRCKQNEAQQRYRNRQKWPKKKIGMRV